MADRPVRETVKWILIGFVVAGFLYLIYHLLFHAE